MIVEALKPLFTDIEDEFTIYFVKDLNGIFRTCKFFDKYEAVRCIQTMDKYVKDKGKWVLCNCNYKFPTFEYLTSNMNEVKDWDNSPDHSLKPIEDLLLDIKYCMFKLPIKTTFQPES